MHLLSSPTQETTLYFSKTHNILKLTLDIEQCLTVLCKHCVSKAQVFIQSILNVGRNKILETSLVLHPF